MGIVFSKKKAKAMLNDTVYVKGLEDSEKECEEFRMKSVREEREKRKNMPFTRI